MKALPSIALLAALSSSPVWSDNQFNDLQFPPTNPAQATPTTPMPYGMNAPMQQPFMAYAPYGMPPYTASSYPYAYNTYPYGQPFMPPPPNYAVPQNQAPQQKKPWGDTRNIWPDFYTDQTNDMWDKMINAPHDMGYMPGGWRFPSLSTPDPVTVGDAVANQVPPVMEEIPNFMNFSN